MARPTNADRLRRLQLVSAGYCASCNAHPASAGFKTCASCRKRQATYIKERAQRLRKEGFCHKCLRRKPPEGQACCPECRIVLTENHRRWRAKPENKIKIRNAWLKSEYGITQAEYEERLIKQGRRCAICGTSQAKLFVDHNHQTNEVRGLLCSACNTLLGHGRDDVHILARAIAYLSPVDSEKEESNAANLIGFWAGT